MESFRRKGNPMTRNQDIGRSSEEFVAKFLEGRGAVILARNYAVHNVGEIDLLCSYKDKILVIEVKSRDYQRNGSDRDEKVPEF